VASHAMAGLAVQGADLLDVRKLSVDRSADRRNQV